MKRIRLNVAVSLALALVLLIGAVPGAFAGPTTPTASNDPYVHAANYFKTHRAPSVAPQTPEGMAVVGTGLNNGRHLTIGPDGGIYVAENGYGDPNNCQEDLCVGATASVTRIENGVQQRIATGMPSYADPSGFGATGATGITWRARDAFFVTLGLGNELTPGMLSDINPIGSWFGTVVRMNPGGYWSYQADIYGYEEANNPDGGPIDSNPYGILAVEGRNRIVADAGGNSLLKVNNSGTVSTIAVFPDTLVPAPPFLGLPPGAQIPMEAVPTSVAQGPGNTYYVSQLTGFPFPPGGAKIYQVWPNGFMQVVADGLTTIVDITTGPDGSIYAVSIAQDLPACETAGICDGRLYKIDPNNGAKIELARNLPTPGGVAVDSNGTIYMTLNSIFPEYAGGGQVVRMN